MAIDFAYDPVTAIDEAKAVGETAVLFPEIRQTMRIPLGLAGMDDSLRLAWAAAKPIYESGGPERALTRSVAAVGLPRPEPLARNMPAPRAKASDRREIVVTSTPVNSSQTEAKMVMQSIRSRRTFALTVAMRARSYVMSRITPTLRPPCATRSAPPWAWGRN
jgi:hypothetical protein